MGVCIISDKCMKYKGKAVRLDSLVDLFKKLKDAVCKNEEGELV